MSRRTFFMLSVLFAFAYAAAAQILVEPLEMDLGTVREGEVVDVPFTVHNNGDAPFNVLAVRFSCGCLSMRELTEQERRLAPGATLTLPIVYDTTGFNGDRAANVVIMTDAPQEPSVMVDVKLFIETPVHVQPRALNFGRQLRGAKLPVEVTIASGIAGNALEVIEVNVPSPFLHFQPRISTSDEGSKITGTMLLTDDAPLGEVRSVLIADLRQGGQSLPVQIPIGVQVLGDLIVTPPMVLHVNKPIAIGAPLSEIRVISTQPEAPVEIVAVRTSGPLQAAEVIAEEDGAYRLPLKIAANAVGGHHAAKVDLFTTSEDTPVVTVPVYLWVSSPLRAQPEAVALETGGAAVNVTLFGEGVVRVETVDVDALEVDVQITEGDDANPTRLSISPASKQPDAVPQTGYLNVVSESGRSVTIPVIVR